MNQDVQVKKRTRIRISGRRNRRYCGPCVSVTETGEFGDRCQRHIFTRVLNSSSCAYTPNTPITSEYLSQECWLEVLVVFAAMQAAKHDFEEPCELHCQMMSNADPLTDLLDCYPKAQTFLPDSANRPPKMYASHRLGCRIVRKNWPIQRLCSCLLHPSLQPPHQNIFGMFHRPLSQPCSIFEYLFGLPSTHTLNQCFRILFQMLVFSL
jgi:hypothetical protein